MRRIRVTDFYINVAKDYESKMKTKQIFTRENNKNIIINPISNLKILRDTIDNKKIPITNNDCSISDKIRENLMKYVNCIIKKLESDDLLAIPPSKIKSCINEFQDNFGNKLENMEISINNNAPKKFSKIISDKMQYQHVRQFVMPNYIRRIGIKSCCYCNINFALTDKNNIGYYQLDHWKPKSLYPYLCISFFNLQPCCASCNMHKNDDDGEYINLYEDDEKSSLDVFCFKLPPQNLIDYISDLNANHLKVQFDSNDSDFDKMRDNTEKKLHITSRYHELCDVVEEVVWRKLYYKGGSYKETFNDAGLGITLNDAQIDRYVFGTYMKAEDIHKRPLSKLRQDIAKQLKITKEK